MEAARMHNDTPCGYPEYPACDDGGTCDDCHGENPNFYGDDFLGAVEVRDSDELDRYRMREGDRRRISVSGFLRQAGI